MIRQRPHVLCLSGHDPSGGAGIHADIEAVGALGGHALTAITAYTVQDTDNVRRVSAAPPIWLAAQIETLLADVEIHAIKLGLLGSVAQIDPILAAIRQLHVPVVMDPILRAGGGARLVRSELAEAMRSRLLPAITVLTPNAAEARALTGLDGEPAAQALLELGAQQVLVTGGDEPGEEVQNHWHRAGEAARRYSWPRLDDRFHGAGCTLAAALATLLARGETVEAAIEGAQRYTHQALSRAYAVGQGRKIPGRRP